MSDVITSADVETLEGVLSKWNAITAAYSMEEVWRHTPDHCHDVNWNATVLVEKLKRMVREERAGCGKKQT